MLRTVASFALIALWLVLLFTGWTLGGLVYGLLLAALVLFPWSELADSPAGTEPPPA